MFYYNTQQKFTLKIEKTTTTTKKKIGTKVTKLAVYIINEKKKQTKKKQTNKSQTMNYANS